ncbi:hypothetical protein [uncultured Butyricimonas sp.]|uniref:hypothetical protein n=1 Tax=uncultured Butyricimonas sp. TaxID=1268785 RepID=UPI0026DC1672|nr:hypothetical protein [uncultured Butyricimonas sp.]
MIITPVATSEGVKIYMTRFHGHVIHLYCYPDGKIYFGSNDVRVMNQFESSDEFKTVMKKLNNNYHDERQCKV